VTETTEFGENLFFEVKAPGLSAIENVFWWRSWNPGGPDRPLCQEVAEKETEKESGVFLIPDRRRR